MRILELITTMSVGGAESMVAALAFEMQARGHSVHVMCIRDIGEMSVPEQRFRDAGIELVELKKEDGFSVGCLRAIAGYCRSHQIQVIHGHSHQVSHYAAVAARMAGIRAVVNTIHGIDALQMQWWAKLLFRSSTCLTSKLVGVSAAVACATVEQISVSLEKVTVIPNGIEADPLLRIPPRQSDGRFVFGTVGRLVPVKNQASMIEAFARVHRNHPNARLEIIGFGDLQSDLEALSSRLGIAGAVVFHGMRTDVPAILAELDCFVLSSLSEGLPMTLLEAMAAGLPVITTAVGGMPEVVEANGCGWLCPPGDSEALAQLMEAAMTAPDRLERGLKSRRAVQQRYSARVMADAYLNVFAGLLPSEHRAKPADRVILASVSEEHKLQ